MIYSPFHKEAALCGTCHDVSNPAFIRQNTTDEEYVFIKNLPGDHKDLAAMTSICDICFRLKGHIANGWPVDIMLLVENPVRIVI